jgi:acyl-CoA thioesterase II
MNLEQFRTMLDIAHRGDEPIVLPVTEPEGQQIFGGQILAQLVAAAAAMRTVKSVHAVFPRSGRPRDPLYLDLEKTHDGRSLGMRRAVVYQDQLAGGRRVVATASVLVDRADDEHDYQYDAVATSDPMAAKPVDFPVVPGEARLISDIGLDDVSAVPAELAFWMRCPDFADTALARPVLAYVSDWPLIGTLLKAVPGLSQVDAHVRLQTGVISHAIWFHQPFDVSQWLRFEIRGQRLAGGRGFGTGAVYTQAGQLVASFAQESVIRSFK